MNFKVGEIKIIIKKDFSDNSFAVEIATEGDETAIIEGFASALTISDDMKRIFNLAVRKANKKNNIQNN